MEFVERHARSTQSSPDPTSYELQTVERNSPDERFHEPSAGAREFSLPPVDGGKDAWLCLMGGFCLEVMIWGRRLLFSVGALG